MNDTFVIMGQYSVIVPFSAGLVRSNTLNREGRWLWLLLATWLVAEVILFVLRYAGKQNTWVSFPLSIFELLLVTKIFEGILKKSVLIWLCSIGIAAWSLNVCLSPLPA